jgi:hypothetical protein
MTDFLYFLGVYGLILFALIGASIVTVGTFVLIKELSKLCRTNARSTLQPRGRDEKKP